MLAGYQERYSGYRLTRQPGLAATKGRLVRRTHMLRICLAQKTNGAHRLRRRETHAAHQPARPLRHRRCTEAGLVPAERTPDVPQYAPAPTHAGAHAHAHAHRHRRTRSGSRQQARVAKAAVSAGGAAALSPFDDCQVDHRAHRCCSDCRRRAHTQELRALQRPTRFGRTTPSTPSAAPHRIVCRNPFSAPIATHRAARARDGALGGLSVACRALGGAGGEGACIRQPRRAERSRACL
jgi:hypothetical protein